MKKLSFISLILLLILSGCKGKEFTPFVTQTKEILDLNESYKAENLIDDVEDVGLQFEVLNNTVDTSKPGDYSITYKISSPDGKKSVEKTFVFRVKDHDAPALTIPDEIKLKQGQSFSISNYATATDSRDGDLTDKITYSGAVNAYKEGTYQITVSVSDSFGNTSSKTVNIIIESGDSASFQKQIAGNYTDITYTSGQAPTLTLNENSTFTLYLNGCSILSAVEGDYVMFEDRIYLRSPQYSFSDKPEEDLVSFAVQLDGTLQFMTELDICAPNYGDIFKKQDN
ncbi:MAG: DUF5011 domain-containing protein [Erysipelotrichaceae bacterium]|nr:DUF5011 domain-containing protein [Erysipelotrichaceae bacterium]